MKFYEDPVFIEMCRQAEEIQGEWSPIKGDWFKYVGLTRGISKGWVHCLGRGIVEYDYDEEQANAPSVDDMYENEEGDWVPGRAMTFANGYDGQEKLVMSECIWLPRLDQLISMCLCGDTYQFLKDIDDWRFAKGYAKLANESSFTSLEQLVLAYVMETKYHKRWTGAEWVNV